MDLTESDRLRELKQTSLEFLDELVIPAEPVYAAQKTKIGPWETSPVMEELKKAARDRGLWNLFLPGEEGAGLSNLEYARIAEITSRSPWIMPEALNCSAPDTGNMEIVANFATPPVRRRWLEPLLAGEIRSVYSMTEPLVASSDANKIDTRIVQDGDGFRISGRKWWSSGAMSPACQVAIVMGRSDPDDEGHRTTAWSSSRSTRPA